MFNLDDIDVDFNDETFDVLKKNIVSRNENATGQGMLSIGIYSSQNSSETNSSKKRCLDNNLNTQVNYNSQSYEFNNVNSKNQSLNKSTNFKFKKLNYEPSSSQYSTDYNSFTSTQKPNTVANLDYLCDMTNKVSPIKSKTQFISHNITHTKMLNQIQDRVRCNATIKDVSTTFTSKAVNQNFNSNTSLHRSPTRNDTLLENFTFPYSPLTSTQKNGGDNKFEFLFDECSKISPIKMKPGICSELRKPEIPYPVPDIDLNKMAQLKMRKFPGPAGCLPKVDNFEKMSKTREFKEMKLIQGDDVPNETNVTESITDFPRLSQPEQSRIWKRTRNIIGEECWHIFQKYSIDNAIKMVAQSNGLFNSKIPVICLALTEIEYLPMDASAKMSDETGSIQCAIHRSVLEKYNEKIKSGSIFILKKVSIFSPSGKKYYLNIITSNVIDIISPDTNIIYHSVITKQDIDDILEQCSKDPRIVFDPSSVFHEIQPESTISKNQPPASNADIPTTGGDNEDFFDDGMDEILASMMDESFEN